MDPTLFGARIRLAREQRGISQEELARLMSRDQRSISEYENGKRRIAAVDLPLLAEILDISILALFEDVPNTHDREHNLLEAFRELPTADAQQILVNIARVLAEGFNKKT